MENSRKILMERIVTAIRDAGYVPYDQLMAYLQTGDDRYITRRDNARVLIHEFDKQELQKMLNQMRLKR